MTEPFFFFFFFFYVLPVLIGIGGVVATILFLRHIRASREAERHRTREQAP